MAGFWWAVPSGNSSQGPRSSASHLPLVFCRPPVVSECHFHSSLNTGQTNNIYRYYQNWNEQMLCTFLKRSIEALRRAYCTCDQSVVTHWGGHSFLAQGCWFEGLLEEQKVSGSSRMLPSANRCLHKTCLLWNPPPQLREHCSNKNTAILCFSRNCFARYLRCWTSKERSFTCPHSGVSHVGGQSKRLQAWTGLGFGFWQSSSLKTSVRLLSREGRWVHATVRVIRPTPQVAEHELHSPASHLWTQRSSSESHLSFVYILYIRIPLSDL